MRIKRREKLTQTGEDADFSGPHSRIFRYIPTGSPAACTDLIIGMSYPKVDHKRCPRSLICVGSYCRFQYSISSFLLIIFNLIHFSKSTPFRDYSVSFM